MEMGGTMIEPGTIAEWNPDNLPAESCRGGLMLRPTITEEPIQPDPLPDTCRECGESCSSMERRICLSELDGRFC